MLALLWVLQVSRFKDTKRVLVGFPPQVSRFKDTWRVLVGFPPQVSRFKDTWRAPHYY